MALQLSNDTYSAQVDSFLITCKLGIIIASFKICIDSWYCLEVANDPKSLSASLHQMQTGYLFAVIFVENAGISENHTFEDVTLSCSLLIHPS